jgi:hypothetical protein
MKGSAEPVSRQITSQDADIAEGNQCTAGFAYIGGGNCQDARCKYNSSGVNPTTFTMNASTQSREH